jgi:NAD+ synthetase
MDYAKVFEAMIDGTQKYLENNNLFAMILGISGGLDSTVTAAICHEVEWRNPELKFYGVSLPCSSNTVNENNSANACMKAFCKKDRYWTENLQKEYMLMKATCSQRHSPTTIGQGNIKARLRMIYLYDLANYTSGLVMDTDNLTEHYLGFFTIHGDVCDFNPIGGLWKHEVYELATYLRDTYDRHTRYYADGFGSIDDRREIEANERKVEALNYALGIRPTDGNGVNDLGDMGQIAPAFAHDKNVDAYTKVDDIIQTYLEYKEHHPEEYQIAMDELHKKYDVDNDKVTYHTVDEVIGRINRTEYKRNGLPVVIPRAKYEMEVH